MMEIIEALRQLHIPYEQIERGHGSKATFWQAARILESSTTYRPLTAQEGQLVAQATLELYDTKINAERHFPSRILTQLANVVPGSLAGLYPALLARDLYWPEGALFREADPATRDSMIALIDSGKLDSAVDNVYTPARLLCMLAWIGDEVVQATFARWRYTPPAGVERPDSLLHEAGWELTADGKRRDLYHQQNWDLLLAEQIPDDALAHAVQVGDRCEEQCGWCGRQLVILLDLDLRDPRLAPLWRQGERLRIPLCLNCTFQFASRDEAVFFDVDGHGLARWSAVNGEFPDHLVIYAEDDINYVASFPRQQYVLGEARRTPFESGGAHLGGCPGWLQGADYPQCPICQQTMTFVGQYDLEMAHVPYTDGFFYAFVCVQCGKATIRHQS